MRIFDNNKLKHPVMDFYMPHDFGGLGVPQDPKYRQMNVFLDTMDLPVIKPKTTVNNKNEFNVALE